MPDETYMQCDVILDSGADTSVLPMRFSDVGEAWLEPRATFVDAQVVLWQLLQLALQLCKWAMLLSERSLSLPT